MKIDTDLEVTDGELVMLRFPDGPHLQTRGDVLAHYRKEIDWPAVPESGSTVIISRGPIAVVTQIAWQLDGDTAVPTVWLDYAAPRKYCDKFESLLLECGWDLVDTPDLATHMAEAKG